MAQAWLLYGQHKPAETSSLLDVLDALGGDREREPLLRGEVSFFRGFVSFYHIDDAHSRECFEDALTNIPEHHAVLRSIVQLHYAASLQKVGQAEAAPRFLKRPTGTTDGRPSPAVVRQHTAVVATHLLEADMDSTRRELKLFGGPALQVAGVPMEGLWRFWPLVSVSFATSPRRFSEYWSRTSRIDSCCTDGPQWTASPCGRSFLMHWEMPRRC